MFTQLFNFKAWSDAELLSAVRNVSSEKHGPQLHAMTRTLNHIHVVDQIFKAHLTGEKHGFTMANTEDTPTLDALAFGYGEVDAWYQDYASKLSSAGENEALNFRFTDGDAGQMTRAEMLHHVLAHGAYHRGNVGQMLKGIDIAPPRDLFTKYLHTSEPARRTHS
jgi:uncharacterized damage-inducible protein DinB